MVAEEYLKSSQTTKMELFAKILQKPITIVEKAPSLMPDWVIDNLVD